LPWGTASNGNGRCLRVQRARALKSYADAVANGTVPSSTLS